MTTIDVTYWNPYMQVALENMRRSHLSIAEMYLIPACDKGQWIFDNYGYRHIINISESRRYIETDLTEEQFIEIVKQYL